MNPAQKHDNGKTRWDLLPIAAIEQIAKVLSFGAAKYAPNAWQRLPDFDARYYAALQRHFASWRRGELIDPESGLPHLAHAACCLVFLLSKQVGFDHPFDETPDLDEAALDAPIPYWPTAERQELEESDPFPRSGAV